MKTVFRVTYTVEILAEDAIEAEAIAFDWVRDMRGMGEVVQLATEEQFNEVFAIVKALLAVKGTPWEYCQEKIEQLANRRGWNWSKDDIAAIYAWCVRLLDEEEVF